MRTNNAAWLMLIRACEGTAAANGYRYLFGSTYTREILFDSFDDHPRVRTYEKRDEFIPNGRVDYTTAAGAYQITATTFDRLRGRFPGRWRGFGPQEQDEMALELTAEKLALSDVSAGRLQEAIAKCGGVWASLPSAQTVQPRRSLQFAANVFAEAGGVIA